MSRSKAIILALISIVLCMSPVAESSALEISQKEPAMSFYDNGIDEISYNDIIHNCDCSTVEIPMSGERNSDELLSSQVTTFDAGDSDYITDLFLIADDSSSVSCPGRFTKIRKDLNEGAGGDFVYLCYTKNTTYNYGYVTEIAVQATNSSTQAAPFRNDRIMWWLKGISIYRGRTGTLTIDVNQAAGGKYILIYYQLGPIENAIRDVDIISSNSSNPHIPDGWTKINVDLNAGAGGKFIYLIYRR